MRRLGGNKDLLPTECLDFEILESKTTCGSFIYPEKLLFSFPAATPIRIDTIINVLFF